MGDDAPNQRLSRISTCWTLLREAQGEASPGNDPSRAQERLLQDYGGAIYRYLLGAMKDLDATDEIFQDFALRFVRGDFHRADPTRGRFRDYLKTALCHMIVDAQRRRKRATEPLPRDGEGAKLVVEEAPRIEPEDDRRFLEVWRNMLLARAWEVLAAHQGRTGQPVQTVLKFRIENPEIRSPEMAEHMKAVLGRDLSPQWVRKKLSLARTIFTDALLDAVAQSLADPCREEIEQELIDLGLLAHCREALGRRRFEVSG